MDVKTQQVVGANSDGTQHLGKEMGFVLPISLSQKNNTVGIHWLRISFAKQHLQAIVKLLSDSVWSKPSEDGFGLWSYDSRYYWQSGASLNYDRDNERSVTVHADRITLDIPGSALDELTAPDLGLLINFFDAYGGKCGRIDVYFDDYKRIVSPHQIVEVAENNDFSGFRHVSPRQKYDRGTLIRDEISFGERGKFGNGKYLRFYDKDLESNHEHNCCRWEVEFTKKKADAVFKKIAEVAGDMNAFATLCGSLVAGSVTFIHRTGDKNLSRLERYDWWERILEILGESLNIRIARKKDSLTGKMEWIGKNVSPNLACLKKVFINDRAFLRWLFDLLKEGDSRMNPFTEQLARTFEGSIDYHWGAMKKSYEESDYELSQL